MPWLWAVSVLFYRHRAYEPDAHPELRRCTCCNRSGRFRSPPRALWLADSPRRLPWVRVPDVHKSSVALIISTAAVVLWFTLFQLFWQDWGSAGRSLLVVDVTQYW